MNKSHALAGAIASDLFRVANLYKRNADQGALRFLFEAHNSAKKLEIMCDKKYIKKISKKIIDINNLTDKTAEDLLMYAVLLQNYSLPKNSM